MHFHYLDESGCTGSDLANAEQPVFVLGGISVRDEGWNATQEKVTSKIGTYLDGTVPEDFELHASGLLSPDGDGPFAGHDRERRNALALDMLGLVVERSHDIHLLAIDKRKLSLASCPTGLPYDAKTPYLLAYDYLITYVNWFVKEKLGRSARAMLIIDAKEQFHRDIERITHVRRFRGPASHRVKWIVEFSYPVDSQKNPMVQLSDLIVFCARKFLEIDNGYCDDYPDEAKSFYAKCYAVIHDRIRRKNLVAREGRGMDALNALLGSVRSTPVGQWKRRYGL